MAAEINGSAEEARKLAEAEAAAAKARAQQDDAHIKSQQEYLEYVRETIDSEQQQVALLQAQVDYADDARGLAQRRAELEADFKKLTGESKDEFVALAMEAFELNETLAANAANAKDLATALENAASAMASLSTLDDALTNYIDIEMTIRDIVIGRLALSSWYEVSRLVV